VPQSNTHGLGLEILRSISVCGYPHPWCVLHRAAPSTVRDRLGKYAYVPQVMAALFLYTWIFNNTGGSVLLAILLHAYQGAMAHFIPMF
jgi:hypothetical protein